MADISKALSDVLDTSQTKDRRLSTLLSLHQSLQQRLQALSSLHNLENRERLRDLLDAAHSKWKRLTDLFIFENDLDTLKQLSAFLSETGKTAILYGRLTGSLVHPSGYLSWIQEQIWKNTVSMTQFEILLEGLKHCLIELEPTAYKALAPGLLTACRLAMERQTPITMFGSILDTMQLLCKVPSAVRDQFIEIVDLVLGWGSHWECSWETTPKIRSLFLQLRPKWQFHSENGSKLILTLSKDLCNLLDTQLKDNETAIVFRNTFRCLVAVFESCSPFLQPAMLSQGFAHVRSIIRAITLLPSSCETSLALKAFPFQLSELLSILVQTLIDRNVPNVLLMVLKNLNEAIEENPTRLETVQRIVHLHERFLKIVVQNGPSNVLYDALIVTYGSKSVLYKLRSSRSNPLVKDLIVLYSSLISDAKGPIQQYFIQLLLQNLEWRESVLEISEIPFKDSTSGGRIPTLHEKPRSKMDGVLEHVDSTQRTKQQLFALMTFLRCFEIQPKNEYLKNAVWNSIVNSTTQDALHDRVQIQSIKLLRKIWLSIEMEPSLLFDAISRFLKSAFSVKEDKIGLLLLQWLVEIVKRTSLNSRSLSKVEDALITILNTIENVASKCAVLEVIGEVTLAGFTKSSRRKVLSQLMDLASHNDPRLSNPAMEILKASGFCCLIHFYPKSNLWLRLITQPQICNFRSSQIATFLKKLTSGLILNDRTQSSIDWILSLSSEIASLPETQSGRRFGFEDLSLISEKAFLLVHESAKFLVGNRFRSFESGPTYLFKVINDRLSDIKTQLVEEKPVDRFHVWMLLEFLSALQKQTFSGYDGAFLIPSQPPSNWNYYIANRDAFEDGFLRLAFKTLFVCHRCDFHRHAAQIGSAFLHRQSRDAQKHSEELNKASFPKQTVLKLRSKPSEGMLLKLQPFFLSFVESIQLTCLSMIQIGASESIHGLHAELCPILDAFVSTMTDLEVHGCLQWMKGCVLEAKGNYEQSVSVYETEIDALETLNRAMDVSQNADVASSLKNGMQIMKQFLLERLSVCYAKISDLPSFLRVGHGLENIPSKTLTLFQHQIHQLDVFYDAGHLETVKQKLKEWKAGFFEASNFIDANSLTHLVSLTSCLRYKNQLECQAIDQDASHLPFDSERRSFVPDAFNDILEIPELRIRALLEQERHLLSVDDSSQNAFSKLYPFSDGNRSSLLRSSLLEAFKTLLSDHLDVSDSQILYPHQIQQEMRVEGVQLDSDWLKRIHRVAQAQDRDQESSTIALIAAGNEIDRGNHRRANAFLQSIESVVLKQSEWQQVCFEVEKWRWAFSSGSSEEKASSILKCAERLLEVLKETDGTHSSLDALPVLVLWLLRFAEQLDPFQTDPEMNKILQNMDFHIILHPKQMEYYKQMRRKDPDVPSGGFLESIPQIQAFCISRALTYLPKKASTWKAFSKMLLRANPTPQFNQLESNFEDPPSNSDEQSALSKDLIVNAASALCQCLKWGTGSVDYEVFLEVFELIRRHGHWLFLSEALVKQVFEIPESLWKHLCGLLHTLLNHFEMGVCGIIAQILKRISTIAPSIVLYPVLFEYRTDLRANVHPRVEIQNLVMHFRRQNSSLVNEANILMDELCRLNSLLSEEWLSILSDAQIESHVRLGVMKEELKALKHISDFQTKAKMTKDAYDCVMRPLGVLLRTILNEKREEFSETPFERQYWNKYLVKIDNVIASLETPMEDISLQDIQKRWSAVRLLLKELTDEVKIPLPSIHQIAPKLSELKSTTLPIPGNESNDVTISHFLPDVEILSTKTRPKKLTLSGSDGKSYVFLLKGKEDLHMDQYLIQFIRLMNGLSTNPQRPSLRTYSVTPLGDQMGLIQWVEQTTSFFALFRQWQTRQQRKLKDLKEGIAETVSLPMLAMHHPRETFQKTLTTALMEANIPRMTPRISIPEEILLQVFERLLSEAPSQLLYNEIWGISVNPADQWKKTQTFTQSIALGSVLCFLLGIGDRHLDNMLLDTQSAQVVNIDFNLCFGSGEKLRIPEIVPFRITRVIQIAMGFGGREGVFKKTFVEALCEMRTFSRSLLIFLDTILMNPVVDWAVERTKRSSHQNLELALQLKLHFRKLETELLEVYSSFLNDTSDALRDFLDSVRNHVSFEKQTEALIQKRIQADGSLSTTLNSEAEALKQLEQCEMTQWNAQSEFQEVFLTIEHLLKLHENECLCHSRLLSLILNSEDEFVLSKEKWLSKRTQQPMDFVVSDSEMTILNVLFGKDPPSSLLPEILVAECTKVDEQSAHDNKIREDVCVKILDVLKKYSTIVKHLFSTDYICNNHHFKWMIAFRNVTEQNSPQMNGVTATALFVNQGQSNGLLASQGQPSVIFPSEGMSNVLFDPQDQSNILFTHQDHLSTLSAPRDQLLICLSLGHSSHLLSFQGQSTEDIRDLYMTLSSAFCFAENLVESIHDSSPENLEASKEMALIRMDGIRRSLSSEWNRMTVEAVFRGLCVRFLYTLEHQTNESSISFWIQQISGFAQICRLFKDVPFHQDFFETIWDVVSFDAASGTTGFSWLDCVEAYASSLPREIECIKNGVLIDLKCFAERSSFSAAKELANRFRKHRDQMAKLSERAWEIHLRETHFPLNSQISATQVRSDHRNRHSKQFLKLPIEGSTHSSSMDVPLLNLSSKDSFETGISLELHQFMEALEKACQSFIEDLCGLTQRMLRIENSEDAIDLHFPSLEWGQLRFPILHALFKVSSFQFDSVSTKIQVFESYEASTTVILPLLEQMHTNSVQGTSFPSSMAKLNCWLDNTSLAASLTQWVYENVQGHSQKYEDMDSLVEDHYVSILKKTVKPILCEKLRALSSNPHLYHLESLSTGKPHPGFAYFEVFNPKRFGLLVFICLSPN